MKNLGIEYEIRCDLAAERLAAARIAVRTARAAYDAAKLQDETRPDRESRLGLEIAEFDLWRAERNERSLSTPRDASRSH